MVGEGFGLPQSTMGQCGGEPLLGGFECGITLQRGRVAWATTGNGDGSIIVKIRIGR